MCKVCTVFFLFFLSYYVCYDKYTINVFIYNNIFMFIMFNINLIVYILIILYMYFGRVGVLTISLGFLSGDRVTERFRYAQTSLLIG